jgi:hypothetical protein
MNNQTTLQGIDSPFKTLARQLDDPSEKEANAWANLTRLEKIILVRGAMQTEAITLKSWFELVSSQRMAIRSVMDKVGKAAAAFGCAE